MRHFLRCLLGDGPTFEVFGARWLFVFMLAALSLIGIGIYASVP